MLSRSTLAHIYDKVKAKTTSPSIGSAKRGRLSSLVLHRARNARILFKQQIDFLLPAAAARSAADETIQKRQRCLIDAFNGTDAPVSGATAAVYGSPHDARHDARTGPRSPRGPCGRVSGSRCGPAGVRRPNARSARSLEPVRASKALRALHALQGWGASKQALGGPAALTTRSRHRADLCARARLSGMLLASAPARHFYSDRSGSAGGLQLARPAAVRAVASTAANF